MQRKLNFEEELCFLFTHSAFIPDSQRFRLAKGYALATTLHWSIRTSEHCTMDARTMKENPPSNFPRKIYTSNTNKPFAVEGRKIEYKRSFSQGNARRKMFSSVSYFSLESLLLLVCLTASLLILPLILPPLPPPPLMLLLLPVCIFAVLMILAFLPSSNVRDITQTCA
ncbi:hypothetical protein LguiA_002432 [Lonicera macranthoides]